MIAWLPQASYPCGNFSDTPNLIIKGVYSVHSFESQASDGSSTFFIHTAHNLRDR